jgi:hypothetical protein
MNAGSILAQLPPYRAKVITLARHQDTDDIVQNMLRYHKMYRSDYDQICGQFLAATPRKTLKNIYDFLKENVKYRIEPETRQTLKSPAAIVATGRTTGSDCKNYALFICGVAESLTRTGKQKIPCAYRFASYKWYDEQPQHVFAVAFPDTDREIWVDPVLPEFDQRKTYNHSTDKKMSLVGISGTDNGGQVAGIKDIFRNVKNAVLTVAAAPSRAAFLTAVSLNALKVAEKLRQADMKYPADLQKWWQNLGGNYTKLREVIDKGMSRRNVGQVGEVVTISAIITAAAPVIVALVDFLKARNIDAYELQGAGDAAINDRANQAALPYEIQQQLNAEQYAAGQAATNAKIPTVAIIGGAALLAFMLMKKR